MTPNLLVSDATESRADYRAPDRRPLRVVLAGAGYIAEYHLAILRENAEIDVVGVCDPDQSRRESIVKRWGVPHAAASLTALLDQTPADVVHVLTPPQTHVAVVTEALNLGLHVFGEKPLTLSLTEIDALDAMASARGLRLDANHNAVWHPQFLRLKADIAARRFGAIQSVVAMQNVPLPQLAAGAHTHWMFRQPRNVLFEQGPHPLSQICDLLGPALSCEASVTNRRSLRTAATFYDDWQISLEYGGASAHLSMAFAGSFPYWQLHVIGQDASARVDLLANTYVIDQVTPSVPPVDAFRRGVARGASEAAGAGRQMLRYVGATLRLTGRRDPYYLSMKGSIDAFYDRLSGGRAGLSMRIDRQVAAALDLIADALPREATTAAPSAAPAVTKSSATADVLVIGSSGFIGQHVVEALAASGKTIRVMARTPAGLPESVRSAAIDVAEGDVRDAEAVARAVRGCRQVVHLVAAALEGWDDYQRLFTDGTRLVAEACLANGVERLVFASSIASLYLGERGAVATNEMPPDDRLQQRGDYARAKALCERMLLDLHRSRGLPVVIVRPAIVVGAGGPPEHLGVGHWASPTRCISWGSADHALPFVLVSDVASAIVSALRVPGIEGRAFNLSGDVPLRASEYVSALADVSGRDVRLVRRSIAGWWALEHFGWAVKAVGRKANNSALSWRELSYRAAATRLDCADTKQTLGWAPESDRDRFIDRGIRAAVRSRT